MTSELEALVDLLPKPETIANPYPVYSSLRPHTPVYGYCDYPPGTVPGQDEAISAWVLMKHDEVNAAALDHATFSSRDPLQEQSSAPSLMLVNHDNPEHDHLRRFVNVPFSLKHLESLKPWIKTCIADMVGALKAGDTEVVANLTSIIPARVMMRLLGQPDHDALQCRDWANAFMLSADLTAAEREASNQAMAAYFIEHVTTMAAAMENGAEPPSGLIGMLLSGEVEGAKLSMDEVIRFCMTLVVAGAETTTYLLTNLLYNLATMPEMVSTLRADPRQTGAFINETMRHSGPPQRLFRVASRDVDINGRMIKAGDWVALFFGAANHDPEVFPNPEAFDITRKNLRQQLSMGAGIHHCLGFALAKSEAISLVEAVVTSFPNLRLGSVAPTPQTASLLTHSFEKLTLNFDPQ